MPSRAIQATTAGGSTLGRNCGAEGQARKLESEKEILGQAPGSIHSDRKEPAGLKRTDGRGEQTGDKRSWQPGFKDQEDVNACQELLRGPAR